MTFWVAGAVVGSSLINSMGASDAADTAAQASGQASAASIAEQRRQYDQSRADYAPYLAAGTGAVNRLGAGVGYGGEFGSTTPFNFNYADYKDPSLQFSLDENLRRMRHGRAAAGTYAGGGGIKEEDRYLAGLMSTDYQNAFNRALTGFNANTGERNALFNRLASVADKSQQAVGGVTAQGANAASNIGASLMGSAANTGNAAMASAGIRNSAFGGAANVLGRMYGPQLAGGYGNYGYKPLTGSSMGPGSFDGGYDSYSNVG